MFISDYVGKSVLSLADAKYLGYVLNVCFDDKFSKIQSFWVVNDEDEFDYSLSVCDVVKVSRECVFVEDESSVVVSNQVEMFSAIGKRAVCLENGEHKIKDVEVSSLNAVRRVLLWDGNSVGVARCVCFGGGGLIFGKNGKSVRNCSPKTVSSSKLDVSSISNKAPFQVSPIDFSKMVGTRLVKTLSLPNGEVYAKKGQLITDEIISVAKKFGILANLL